VIKVFVQVNRKTLVSCGSYILIYIGPDHTVGPGTGQTLHSKSLPLGAIVFMRGYY